MHFRHHQFSQTIANRPCLIWGRSTFFHFLHCKCKRTLNRKYSSAVFNIWCTKCPEWHLVSAVRLLSCAMADGIWGSRHQKLAMHCQSNLTGYEPKEEASTTLTLRSTCFRLQVMSPRRRLQPQFHHDSPRGDTDRRTGKICKPCEPLGVTRVRKKNTPPSFLPELLSTKIPVHIL